MLLPCTGFELSPEGCLTGGREGAPRVAGGWLAAICEVELLLCPGAQRARVGELRGAGDGGYVVCVVVLW